jgi:hypothetical protein
LNGIGFRVPGGSNECVRLEGLGSVEWLLDEAQSSRAWHAGSSDTLIAWHGPPMGMGSLGCRIRHRLPARQSEERRKLLPFTAPHWATKKSETSVTSLSLLQVHNKVLSAFFSHFVSMNTNCESVAYRSFRR